MEIFLYGSAHIMPNARQKSGNTAEKIYLRFFKKEEIMKSTGCRTHLSQDYFTSAKNVC